MAKFKITDTGVDISVTNTSNLGISLTNSAGTKTLTRTGLSHLLSNQLVNGTHPWTSNNYYDNSDVDGHITAEGPVNYSSGKISVTTNSANGLLKLNSSNKIDSTYLPASVDEIIMVANYAALPSTGQREDAIYVTEDTNKTYRWGGSDYVVISETLALGDTSTTAYAGNLGAANASAISANTSAISLNSTDISKNKTSISDNATSISNNATSISNNATAINDNKTLISNFKWNTSGNLKLAGGNNINITTDANNETKTIAVSSTPSFTSITITNGSYSWKLSVDNNGDLIQEKI